MTNHKNIFDELTKNSEIKVEVTSWASFKHKYSIFSWDSDLYGVFLYTNELKNKEPVIFINKSLKVYKRIPVFFHEYGHYKCWKNRCDCTVLNNMLIKEEHAFDETIQKCIEYNLPKCLKWTISETQRLLDQYSTLFSSAAWLKGQDFIKRKSLFVSFF